MTNKERLKEVEEIIMGHRAGECAGLDTEDEDFLLERAKKLETVIDILKKMAVNFG